eukprot:TRINITY_DN9650_c0_g1_i12.p1 TRINITY_DN9650_c0_g1~~TRINITY_DN9650_c0_g1_i12.p1  ORF type:complete len:132 (+),score=37.53 TRINITY_DN9650_c0_g1_i12:77-472(+)
MCIRDRYQRRVHGIYNMNLRWLTLILLVASSLQTSDDFAKVAESIFGENGLTEDTVLSKEQVKQLIMSAYHDVDKDINQSKEIHVDEFEAEIDVFLKGLPEKMTLEETVKALEELQEIEEEIHKERMKQDL